MKENEIVRIKDGVCVKAEVVNFSTDVEGSSSPAPVEPSKVNIYQHTNKAVNIHCDKILEKLIAEGADVDVEVEPDTEEDSSIDVGIYYADEIHTSLYFIRISTYRNSNYGYKAQVQLLGNPSEYVYADITEDPLAIPTVRQMLEAAGTIQVSASSNCWVSPQLCFNYKTTGCFALTVPLTIDEYLEMIEFNVEVTV